MSLIDAPQWIRDNYSSTGNMGGLADRLQAVIADISPYVEDSFWSNHFRSELDEKRRDKKLWEGLWHLHVLWSLYTKGVSLKKPITDDDILAVDRGIEAGIETTFSNWGDPSGSLATMHKNMSGFVPVNTMSQDIATQAITVLDSKNEKLTKRQPKILRVVTLNEVDLANGFVDWNKETAAERRQTKNPFRSHRKNGRE